MIQTCKHVPETFIYKCINNNIILCPEIFHTLYTIDWNYHAFPDMSVDISDGDDPLKKKKKKITG